MTKIMSDTSILMSTLEALKEGIMVVPLHVTIAGKSHKELDEISAAEFLDLIRQGHIPKSSQPAIGDTLHCYESLSADDELINISMADGLSGTYHSAVSALSMTHNKDRIHVINSTTLCGPHRYIVAKAKRFADLGKNAKEILESIEESISSARSFLIPQDFDYLRRGGRLAPFAAHIGGALKLVPIMTQSKDGKRLERHALCRTFSKAIESIAAAFKNMEIGENHLITISHAENESRASELFCKLSSLFPKTEIETLKLGPGFITQGGPGCVAIQSVIK